ncbi:MarR family transcriptional regulator [Pseudonocardia nematodicida]|uniref:MarR family transcriptional regulator n=1 Tax=Pseudonocardia nematodicida TaxID=1206997 RepID=A0ABV1KH15_9PSEU
MTERDPTTEIYRRYLAAVVRFHLRAAEAAGLGPTDYQAASLLELDGPTTAGALGRRLGLTPGSATRVVDRLVAAGLARRVPDPGDRRRVLVEHTGVLPPGLTEILDRVREPIGAAVADLSSSERAGLVRYLTVAERAYRDALECSPDGMIEESTTWGRHE